MSPSSWRSDDDPFAVLVGRGAGAESTSTHDWLEAMLYVEKSLAAAQAEVGDIPADAVTAIDAIRVEQLDLEAIASATERGGVAVIGLVEQLRAAVGHDVAEYVHRGATSQDILDTAAMLIARRCAAATAERLDEAAGLLDRLVAAHGDAALIARTLGQYALPTTFGAVAGRWRRGLHEASRELRSLRHPVQLGGPAGDRSSYGERAQDILHSTAARLDLAVPSGPWSSMRTPIARIAGAWGVVATAVGDTTTQLLALMASDVGELAERAEGAGGSSSMAHKHNPVAAISARAAAMQTPGLVATLLQATGSHDFERASGAWHAEWPALNALLRCGASAADWLTTSLERVVVDVDRMAVNLQRAAAERAADD